MELLLGIGIGIGLAAVAGLRAFLPLALVGIFTLLLVFELPAAADLSHFAVERVVFETVTALVVLLALTVLEISLDKVPATSRLLDILGIPLGILSGALLFATATGVTVRAETAGEAAPALLAGGAIAGLVAYLRLRFRPSDRVSAGVSAGFMSVMTDVVALVGSVVGIFVPFAPVVLVAFLLFFFYRVRKRRGRKYEGLRILGD